MQQLQTALYSEQRECRRLQYESVVIVQNTKTGKSHLGKLYDYSRLGSYFELDEPLDPGSDVCILIQKSPYLTTPTPISAKVMWCRKNDGPDGLFRYGIGVKYSQDVNS